MANIHLSYSEFKARFGDLGVTEWVKYNWLSDYTPGPVTEKYLVDFATVPAHVTAIGNGEYEEGDTVQVIITPESGYRWGEDNAPKANGIAMDSIDNTFLYEFEMPAEDVTIVFTDVDVELIPYDVTVTPIANCTIAGAGTYTPGTTVTIQLSANAGYRWASGNAPKIDGNLMTQSGNFFMYSFVMPSANVNIVITDVAVELTTYNVTISSVPTGTTVSGAVPYIPGRSVTITLACDVDHQWGTGNAPKANGTLMTQSGGSFKYNFTMPSQDVVITFTDVITELIPIYRYTWSEPSADTLAAYGVVQNICQDDDYFYTVHSGGSKIGRIPKNNIAISNMLNTSTMSGNGYLPAIGQLDDGKTYLTFATSDKIAYFFDTSTWSSDMWPTVSINRVNGSIFTLGLSEAIYGNNEFRYLAKFTSSVHNLNTACLSIKYDASLGTVAASYIDIVADDQSMTEAEKTTMRNNCIIVGMRYDPLLASSFDGWSYLIYDTVNTQLYWYGAHTSAKITMTLNYTGGSYRFINFEAGSTKTQYSCLYFTDANATSYIWQMSKSYYITQSITLPGYTNVTCPAGIPFKRVRSNGTSYVQFENYNVILAGGRDDNSLFLSSPSYATAGETIFTGTYLKSCAIDPNTGVALIVLNNRHIVTGTPVRIN